MRRQIVPVKRNITPAVRATQYGSLQIDPVQNRRPNQSRTGLTCFLFGAFFVPLAFFIFFCSSPLVFQPLYRKKNPFFLHSPPISPKHDHLPIIFLHGLEQGAHDGHHFHQWLADLRPNQTFLSLSLYEFKDSLANLDSQVDGIIARIRELHSDPAFSAGYHLIGHSQGAVLLRCVIQSMADHRTKNFISLAGPQMGVYGTGWLSGSKYDWVRFLFSVTTLYEFFYSSLMQTNPVGQFWHDPNPSHGYLKKNSFLPHWNGLLGEIPGHKENFLKVGRAYFFSGNMSSSTFDGGIDPWNTGVWEFYDENMEFRSMNMQPEYELDNFGLQSLDKRGDMYVEALPDVGHSDWLRDRELFVKHLLPLLY